MTIRYDAVVIGAGPNGLAAAVELARNGKSVLVVEGHDTIGGGCRTAELTLPGFRHDVCAAVHPFAVASPYLTRLPLDRYGLQWVFPEIEFTHPLDSGGAGVLHRSVADTAAGLGADGRKYARMMNPFVAHSDALFSDALGPLVRIPRHPLVTGRFGAAGALPMTRLAGRFGDERTRAMLAGLGAHSMVPLSRPFTGGVGLALAVAGHAVGWPVARGGSAAIVDALAAYLRDLGGEIRTGSPVVDLDDLPPAGGRAGGRDAAPTGGDGRWAHRSRRPHTAATLATTRSRRLQGRLGALGTHPLGRPGQSARGTVHVGGTMEEIATAEAATYRGETVDRPFVLVAQPTLLDDSRAPAGSHTAWAYCHVPTGSPVDMTDRIERQVERFAPGFGSTIVARATMSPADYEAYNPNNAGGDITGGELTVRRLIAGVRPYATPLRDVYLCSSSTPPGAGVHGMCGYHAARAALHRSLRG